MQGKKIREKVKKPIEEKTSSMAILNKALFIVPLLLVIYGFTASSGFETDPIVIGGTGLQESFFGEDFAKKPNQDPEVDGGPKPDFETNYMGVWKIHSMDAGVSAMHMQLLPNNKAVLFDAASLGPSKKMLPLPHPENCRPVPGRPKEIDCWSHAVEYDIETAETRPLKVLTDSWCSSGGLATDGSLVNTGGFVDGDKAVRLLSPCETCDFRDKGLILGEARWYSSQQVMEDGNFIVVGGRRSFSYEFVPNSLDFQIQMINLPFLFQTTDNYENNLYPFVYLLPDGNVFLFANNRAIIFNSANGKTVKELPVLPGGSRNYPASGMSALLPLKLSTNPNDPIDAEVLVCGGGPTQAAKMAEYKILLPSLQDCGRISVMNKDAKWEIETMPSKRVMGDMLLLPTGDVLILNGATSGISGWQLAEGPNLTPVLYSTNKPAGDRFKELKPTQIPRMYHSSSAVLPDGRILVAGSNTNPSYNFTNLVDYRTEMRVEKFAPPYLDHLLDKHRPEIVIRGSETELVYGQQFKLQIELADAGVTASDIKVTMLAPPFTTHGYSQNQRLLILGVVEATNDEVTAVAPPSGKIAPPGYYLLYVVHRGVPSTGIWVQIHA